MIRALLGPVLLAALVAAPDARAQLGIDLSAPPKDDKAPAKKPAAEPPRRERGPTQAPGLNLTPLDEAARAAAKTRLDSAKRLLDEGAVETAALALDQLLRDPAPTEIHEEARFHRAKALARLGLGHSALAAFDDILERGPGRFYDDSMEWLFRVGRALSNEQPLLSRVARHAGKGIPGAHEDRVSYLLAKYEFERGRALLDAGRASEAKTAFGEARRLAAKVQPARGEARGGAAKDAPSPGARRDPFARARFVDGLVLYAQRDFEGATEAFKDVVRLTNPRKTENADAELRELAFLQLARIHYQHRQNRYAIFYYGKMPWGGERWLEGLWEASYAHYRIGDYEKTLGNLLTLQSPYFGDEYFPESYVLKAIVYYENCRYPEARQVLEQFSRLYEPVYDELVRAMATRRTPDGDWELVRDAGRRSGAARKIAKVAFADQNVRQLAESIAEMEREADVGVGRRRPEFRDSPLGKQLAERLRADRATLAAEAGARARAKLELERDQLRQLLAQALRIRIEVSRKEREALEGSLAKGSQVDVVRDLKYSHAVSDEHLYWPYDGEFWRDELGTYSYTLTKGCKDRLSGSRTAAR